MTAGTSTVSEPDGPSPSSSPPQAPPPQARPSPPPLRPPRVPVRRLRAPTHAPRRPPPPRPPRVSDLWPCSARGNSAPPSRAHLPAQPPGDATAASGRESLSSAGWGRRRRSAGGGRAAGRPAARLDSIYGPPLGRAARGPCGARRWRRARRAGGGEASQSGRWLAKGVGRVRGGTRVAGTGRGGPCGVREGLFGRPGSLQAGVTRAGLAAVWGWPRWGIWCLFVVLAPPTHHSRPTGPRGASSFAVLKASAIAQSRPKPCAQAPCCLAVLRSVRIGDFIGGNGGGRGWGVAQETSTREPLLGMPAGACHALPGRPVLPPLVYGLVSRALRRRDSARLLRFAGSRDGLTHASAARDKAHSGRCGGRKSGFRPHIRLESCSPRSVLQPQSRTFDVNRSRARRAVLSPRRRTPRCLPYATSSGRASSRAPTWSCEPLRLSNVWVARGGGRAVSAPPGRASGSMAPLPDPSESLSGHVRSMA